MRQHCVQYATVKIRTPGAGPKFAARLLGQMGDDRERFDDDAQNLRHRPGRSRLALRQFL